MAAWFELKDQRLTTTVLVEKTGLKIISEKDMKAAIIQLNNRSRKRLDFKTPAKLMVNHMAAIAA